MKLLIVEDEKDIRNYLFDNFKKEGYAVDLAENGEEGSFMARTREYDAMILDNAMPKKTGLQVCEEVRQDGNNLPIIMLSVKSEATTKVDLLNAGADDYVTKPFSMDELSARIKALLRRPKAIESEIIRIDDLEMDIGRHIVKRGKDEIQLTKKEFALLKYLMKNQGTVLSKNMLMEHVWDTAIDPFSNTIESHIMSLRKKIDAEGKKKLIHTIKGAGYKIS